MLGFSVLGGRYWSWICVAEASRTELNIIASSSYAQHLNFCGFKSLQVLIAMMDHNSFWGSLQHQRGKRYSFTTTLHTCIFLQLWQTVSTGHCNEGDPLRTLSCSQKRSLVRKTNRGAICTQTHIFPITHWKSSAETRQKQGSMVPLLG